MITSVKQIKEAFTTAQVAQKSHHSSRRSYSDFTTAQVAQKVTKKAPTFVIVFTTAQVAQKSTPLRSQICKHFTTAQVAQVSTQFISEHKFDKIAQYGIDKMELDTRLIKRYQQLVRNHTHPNGYLHAGMKATMDTKSSFAQTQALWRFVNNDNISYQELSKPLLENSLQGCREDCKRYGLLMHDWSRLSLTHHNKQDTYAMTHNLDVGYELQSSVLVSDINGRPIATPAQNLVTANGVHSSYQDTPAKQTHLNELTTRIEYLEQQGFDKPLIHIIDREADSAYHMRQWDAHDYKFITRVKAGAYLSYEGKSQRCSQIAGQLNFSYQRQVNYKGKAAKQYIATAKVVLTRSAKPQAIDPATGKRIAPIKGKPLSLLLTVSRIYDDQDKRLATWYLLSNLQETSLKGADISQWYYWRWQIESYFKLLKSAGLQLESWLQQSGDAYFKRLLIASQACTLVWRIMQVSDKQSQEFALFLVRLSGRQMKRSKPITAPAVMAGLFQWLNFTELVNHYPPDKLREFADAASKFVQIPMAQVAQKSIALITPALCAFTTAQVAQKTSANAITVPSGFTTAQVAQKFIHCQQVNR